MIFCPGNVTSRQEASHKCGPPTPVIQLLQVLTAAAAVSLRHR
jgi:hypothetical protein